MTFGKLKFTVCSIFLLLFVPKLTAKCFLANILENIEKSNPVIEYCERIIIRNGVIVILALLRYWNTVCHKARGGCDVLAGRGAHTEKVSPSHTCCPPGEQVNKADAVSVCKATCSLAMCCYKLFCKGPPILAMKINTSALLIY